MIFTSYRDDSVGGDANGDGASIGYPGDWGAVVLRNGANTFDYTTIRYARYGVKVYAASGHLHVAIPLLQQDLVALGGYDLYTLPQRKF